MADDLPVVLVTFSPPLRYLVSVSSINPLKTTEAPSRTRGGADSPDPQRWQPGAPQQANASGRDGDGPQHHGADQQLQEFR